MNQQPDKFFHDKLDSYRPAVPPSAWQRVSQNLDKKNRRRLLLKVAASILLLASAALLIHPPFNSNQRDAVAENSPATRTTDKHPEPGNDGSGQAGKKPTAAVLTPDKSQTEMERPSTPKVERRKPVATPARDPDATTPVHALSEPSVPVALETKAGEQLPEIEETGLAAAPKTESNNVLIVLTADEVNKKYLTINDEAEATTEDDQTSGLRKLLDKAQDLKHNQDLLGSFRQKKNEILAMNFKGEKEITQND